MKTKVVIAGGTGFVGQGIIQQLDPTQYDVHSLSRHVYHPHTNDKTTYHVVDLSDTPSVLAIIQDADWVIDAVGILFPNPIKKQNYHNSSYAPAKYLIDALVSAPHAKLLLSRQMVGHFSWRPISKQKEPSRRRCTPFYPNARIWFIQGLFLTKHG